MSISSEQREQFLHDAVMSASPARLVTMLYDRMVLDLDRATKSIETGELGGASTHLTHAQDIVQELMGTLDVNAWEGAKSLQALYLHLFSALMAANASKDIDDIKECREIIDPLRMAWHEAAASLAQESAPKPVGSSSGGLGDLGVA
ncbi:flagellar export chaperone FliS [Populibacterium corticicola]|uniref:Flagellar secretion chaperone FliS n=1 Tax=Populibacterium corticicola TaxID=1812826 RepID=A0ABW5XGQ5_9MICO